jgi:hypothetical protein
MLTLLHAPALPADASHLILSDREGIIMRLRTLQQKTRKRRRRERKGIRMNGSTKGRKRGKKMNKED